MKENHTPHTNPGQLRHNGPICHFISPLRRFLARMVGEDARGGENTAEAKFPMMHISEESKALARRSTECCAEMGYSAAVSLLREGGYKVMSRAAAHSYDSRIPSCCHYSRYNFDGTRENFCEGGDSLRVWGYGLRGSTVGLVEF